MKKLYFLIKFTIFSFISITIIILGFYGYAYLTPKENLTTANQILIYDDENNLVFENSSNASWVTLDKISTLRILTADVMQMLIDFKQKNKVTPEIVLNSRGLFIRFELGNVFEPNLIKTDIEYDNLKKTYDLINFTLDLTKKFSENILEFEG